MQRQRCLPFFAVLVVLSSMLYFVMPKTAHAQGEPCRSHRLAFGEGTIHETWTDTERPCVRILFQEEGMFHITGGYVFTAPLILNGVPIETYTVTGQVAPQIPEIHEDVIVADVRIFEFQPVSGTAEFHLNYDYRHYPQPNACRQYDMELGEGTFTETWTDTVIPCVQLTFPETGTFSLTHGYVFQAPIFWSGQQLETYTETGEVATLISPFEVEVAAGSVYTIAFTEMEDFSAEIGVWYNYQPNVEPQGCRNAEVDVTTGTAYFTQVWTDTTKALACINMTFLHTGTYSVQSGYVFTSPVFFARMDVPVVHVEDEVAPQIEPFSFDVRAGETRTLAITPISNTAEIGWWYTYKEPEIPTEPLNRVFMPMVSRIPYPTHYHVTIEEASTVQKSWLGEVVYQQLTCLVVYPAQVGDDWKLTSGWFFGDGLEVTLNGQLLDVDWTPQSGTSAGQISSAGLPQFEVLQVCTRAGQFSSEIGLRLEPVAPQ